MALSDIRTRVADNVNRDDVPDTAGGLIDRWINDTQRRICRGFNYPFMETEATTSTVDEQRSYALPDGSGTELRFKSEINIELIDSDNCRVPLTKAHKQDIENMVRYKDTDDTGTPKYYAIQYNQIHLYDKPDHSDNDDEAWTINFEYYGYLDDLSADADTNDLVDDYPEALEAGATAMAFRHVFEEEKAEYWEQKAKDIIAEMVREAVTNQYGTIEEGLSMRPGSGATTQPGYFAYEDIYE